MSKQEDEVLRYIMQNKDRLGFGDQEDREDEILKYVRANAPRLIGPAQEGGLLERWGGGLLSFLGAIGSTGTPAAPGAPVTKKIEAERALGVAGFVEGGVIKPFVQALPEVVADLSDLADKIPGSPGWLLEQSAFLPKFF